MRVLVIGGTGFIGSHLVERLSTNGIPVTVPVRKGCRAVSPPDSCVEFVPVDRDEIGWAGALLPGVDVVVHLAAVRGSGWSFGDRHVNDVNVRLTGKLVEGAASHAVSHFIYVSSVSVYGHPCGGPISEDYPCSPATRYGFSKYEAEKLVVAASGKRGMAATIVRPVITYGPGDTWGMVPKMARLIYGGRFAIVGKGENRVHLIYIDDLIDGLMLLIPRRPAGTRTYILASDQPVSVRRLAAIISQALSRPEVRLHVPMRLAWFAGGTLEAAYRWCRIRREPLVTRDKVDIVTRDRCFDTARARGELGFAPRIGYQEGLRRTVDWLISSGNIVSDQRIRGCNSL